jgi:hypothetical protein
MAEPVVTRSRRRVLALKAEDTYGHDALNGEVAAADVLYAYNIKRSSKYAVIETLAQVGFLGKLRGMSGVGSFGVSFDMQLRGAGVPYAAAVAPDVDMPWRAAGLKPVLDATGGAEKWTYTKQSSGFESFTVYLIQENGPTNIGVGCFGTVSMKHVAGQPAVLSCTLLGQLVDDQAEELVVKPPTRLLAPVFKSANLGVGLEAYAARVQNLALAITPSVQPVPDANAANALAGYFIADTDIGGSFDPEVVPADSFDWYSLWRDKPQETSLTFRQGQSQYNRFTFSMPEIEVQDLGDQDRNQIQAFNVAYKARPSTAGDDELTIVGD